MTADDTRPSVKASWPHPLVAFLLTVLLFVLGQAVAAVVVIGLLALTGQPRSAMPTLFGSQAYMQFAYGVLAYGVMLAATIVFLRLRRIGWHEFGLSRPRLGDIGAALMAFLVYMAVYVVLVSVVAPLIPGLDIRQQQDTGFGDAAGFLPLLLAFAALVLVAPFTEEVLMRGLLFGSLRRSRKLPFWLAALITSLLFAAFHLSGGKQGSGPLWIAAIDTFLLSLALCYLRERTGRLWAGIALHMIKNGSAFVLLFLIGK